MNNTNFFVQFLTRLISKNPKFFDYLQIAAIILILLSWCVSQAESSGVIFPLWLSVIGDSITKAAAIVVIIVAQLPNVDPPHSSTR